MSIVQQLLRDLERSVADQLYVQNGNYVIHYTTGRQGSICFSLKQQLSFGGEVTLAEGFSLGDRLIFDERRLSTVQVVRILRWILRARENGPELAENPRGDGSEHALDSLIVVDQSDGAETGTR